MMFVLQVDDKKFVIMEHVTSFYYSDTEFCWKVVTCDGVERSVKEEYKKAFLNHVGEMNSNITIISAE